MIRIRLDRKIPPKTRLLEKKVLQIKDLRARNRAYAIP